MKRLPTRPFRMWALGPGRGEVPFTVTADYLAAATLKAFSVLTVALAVTGYGCGADPGPGVPLSPSPTVLNAPPPPSVASPPNSAGELWSLTTAIVSLEGSACFWPHPVGKKFDWTLSVERIGVQVR